MQPLNSMDTLTLSRGIYRIEESDRPSPPAPPPSPILQCINSEGIGPLKRRNALSAHGIKKRLENERVREYFEGCKRAYLEARLPKGKKV